VTITPPTRRPYDSPIRRQQVVETRARIISAASELVHGFASWDWSELTFRAVAERAGVGERTVYRHFPTERHLRDVVMQRLEEEAGITYETVTLGNMGAVTARVFSTLSSFAVAESIKRPQDPTFDAVDHRRKAALQRALGAGASEWTEDQRDTVAALLDVLWNPTTYERLVANWGFDHQRAVKAILWLIDELLERVQQDTPPPP
jgi:AcrR family transcriptional regulator